MRLEQRRSVGPFGRESRNTFRSASSLVLVLFAATFLSLASMGFKDAEAHMWSLLPTSTGFQWKSPVGTVVCKYAGLSLIDSNLVTRNQEFPNLVPGKYPTWAIWGQSQNDRLTSWGFNAAGMYSYKFSQSSAYPSGGVPFVATFQTSGHATRDDYRYHIKNLNHNYNGMICAPRYSPRSGGQIDPFDPGVADAYLSDVATDARYFNKNTMFIVPEEADDLFGINQQNAHEDLAMVIVNGNPTQDKSASGRYEYADHAVYAKLALRDFLAQEYGCSVSANPAAPNYCGDFAAAAALRALNNRWFGKQVYTTWNTTDPGGVTGIVHGTYMSYGKGSGFLDESGAHTLSESTKKYCSSNKANDSWTANPAIEADLHKFIRYFVQIYAEKLSAAWSQSGVNPHPPVILPIYNGPSYAYSGAAPYFNGFWISTPGLDDVRRIIAAASVPGGKSMPIIFGDYSTSNPDPRFSNSTGGGDAPTRTKLRRVLVWCCFGRAYFSNRT